MPDQMDTPVNKAPDAAETAVTTCLPVPSGIRELAARAAIHDPAAPPMKEATIPLGIQFL